VLFTVLQIGPAVTVSPSQNWNISYKIYHEALNSTATTNFMFMCKEDHHFADLDGAFEAVCGWDGYCFL
jgi:hypothetical protein